MELGKQESEELKALETELLQAETRRSADRLAKLLGDEFMEFGSSGKTYDKTQTIAALSDAGTDSQRQLSHFKAQRLGPNLALVTYHVHATSGGAKKEHSLHSSIWRLTKNGWRILFHQGTPGHGHA
jgi:hypothetical protein